MNSERRICLDLVISFVCDKTCLHQRQNCIKMKLGNLNLIDCLLSYQHQYVKVENCSSSSFNSGSGGPQGAISSSLELNIFINDLPTLCCLSEVLLFADETKFYFFRTSGLKIQDKLIDICQWRADDRMSFQTIEPVKRPRRNC